MKWLKHDWLNGTVVGALTMLTGLALSHGLTLLTLLLFAVAVLVTVHGAPE